jgi:hypothetical protein
MYRKSGGSALEVDHDLTEIAQTFATFNVANVCATQDLHKPVDLIALNTEEHVLTNAEV